MSGEQASAIALTLRTQNGHVAQGRNECLSSQTEGEAQALTIRGRLEQARLFHSARIRRSSSRNYVRFPAFSDLHSKALSLQADSTARGAVDAINVRPLAQSGQGPYDGSHSIMIACSIRAGAVTGRPIPKRGPALRLPLASENHLPVFEGDAGRLVQRQLVLISVAAIEQESSEFRHRHGS